MFFPWLNGWLFTHKTPEDVMYVLIIIAVIMCIQLVIMQVVASRHGIRFKHVKKNTELEEMAKLISDEEDEDIFERDCMNGTTSEHKDED